MKLTQDFIDILDNLNTVDFDMEFKENNQIVLTSKKFCGQRIKLTVEIIEEEEES